LGSITVSKLRVPSIELTQIQAGPRTEDTIAMARSKRSKSGEDNDASVQEDLESVVDRPMRPNRIAGSRRAGLRLDERDPDEPPRPAGSAGGGINMSGIPAEGGLAEGGLGGTNFGDGSLTDEAVTEMENAYGAGIYDVPNDEESLDTPFAGRSGGAVGGTPANKRVTGGHIDHGFLSGDNAVGGTIGRSAENGARSGREKPRKSSAKHRAAKKPKRPPK
jgi:hypothetical protein